MTKERACKVKARALKIGKQSGTTWYQHRYQIRKHLLLVGVHTRAKGCAENR